jgi:hypothetical protein
MILEVRRKERKTRNSERGDGECGSPRFDSPETWTPRSAEKLRLLRPARSFPPNLGIVRTVQHAREFLFDLAKTGGAQLESRLIESIVPALFGETGVQVAQISDFLAKAGEVFRDVGHPFDHTLYFSNCRLIRDARVWLLTGMFARSAGYAGKTRRCARPPAGQIS